MGSRPAEARAAWRQHLPVIGGVLLGLVVAMAGLRLMDTAADPRDGERVPAPTQVARRDPLQEAPVTSASARAVADVAPRTLLAWQVIDRGRAEPLRVLRQRAQASGALSDVLAFTAQQARCIQTFPSIRLSDDEATGKLPQAQRQLLQALEMRCEGAPFESLASAIRDRQGFTGDLDALLAAVGGQSVPDADAAQALMAFVRSTGSATLFEATAHSLLVPRLGGLGVSADARFNAVADDALTMMVVRLYACQARGDCAGDGNLFPDCAAFHACVDDLQQLGTRHLFVDGPDRIQLPGLWQPEGTAEEWAFIRRWLPGASPAMPDAKAIQARWNEIVRALRPWQPMRP